MATATLQRQRISASSTDIYNKYLKDLPITEKKEIVFILINSFVEEPAPEPKQQEPEKHEETDEEFNERFRKKHGLVLSPDLQWLNDNPIVLSEETLKDERTQYILSKCSPLK